MKYHSEQDYFDFSNVKFKEKEEKDLCIVSPKLHEIDRDVVSKVYRTVQNKVEDFSQLCPKHFVYDLYNLYYNRTDETIWDINSQHNTTKEKLLKKFNKEKYKIISNLSPVNSFFFLKYLLQLINDYYRDEVSPELREKIIEDLRNHKPKPPPKIKVPQLIEEQQPQLESEGSPEKSSQGQNSESNDNQGVSKEAANDDSLATPDKVLQEVTQSAEQSTIKTQEEVQVEMDEFMEDDTISKKLDEHAQQLFEEIQLVKDGLLDDDDLQSESFEDLLDNINKLDKIKEELSAIQFNKSSLQPLIRQVLNASRNYFSSRTRPEDVPLVESEDLTGLNNLEYLLPALRKVKLLDITSTERHPIGKLDVYFDVSGSMSSRVFDEVTRFTLAKAIVLNMCKLGIVEDVYPFESNVRPKLENEIQMLLSRTRGGTSLTDVIRHVQQTNRNSVIVTDACDSVWKNNYCDKVFFVGINTNFAGIKDDLYWENKQLIHYDSSTGTFSYCTEKPTYNYGY